MVSFLPNGQHVNNHKVKSTAVDRFRLSCQLQNRASGNAPKAQMHNPSPWKKKDSFYSLSVFKWYEKLHLGGGLLLKTLREPLRVCSPPYRDFHISGEKGAYMTSTALRPLLWRCFTLSRREENKNLEVFVSSCFVQVYPFLARFVIHVGADGSGSNLSFCGPKGSYPWTAPWIHSFCFMKWFLKKLIIPPHLLQAHLLVPTGLYP